MTLAVHRLVSFLSSCKQQATKTKPQAAAKQDVNLGRSANSVQTVTQKEVMFQTIKVISNISKYKPNKLMNRAKHNRSKNVL